MGKIPKVIHYCWFGGNPLNDMAVKCIESWKKYCPDYEIKEWNESNYDVNCCVYSQQAYEAKKWAFVSDVARYKILYEYGGIYLDTDVEIIKPLDDIVEAGSFMGMELPKNYIATGLGFGVEPKLKVIKEIIDDYENSVFIDENGEMDLKTIVARTTDILSKYGFVPCAKKQVVANITIYPPEYFCPKDIRFKELNITENTHTIHHFDGSWVSDEIKFYKKLRAKLWKFMPQGIARIFAKTISIVKYRGVKALFLEFIKSVKGNEL